MPYHYDLSAMLASAVSRAGSANTPFALLREFASEIQTTFSTEIIYIAEVSPEGVRQICFAAPQSRRQAVLDEVSEFVAEILGQNRRAAGSGSSSLKTFLAEVLPGVQLLILIDRPSGTEDFQECVEVAADLYRRGLLSVLRKNSAGHQLLSQVLTSLQLASTPAEALNILATDGPSILNCQRIAVCGRGSAAKWKLLAATSVAQPNDRSAAALQLAETVAQFESRACADNESAPAAARNAISQSSELESDVIVRVLPLTMNGQWQNSEYAFVGEWNRTQLPDQNLVTLLALAASTVLDTIEQRNATLWTRFRRQLSRKSRIRNSLLVGAIVLVILALLVPVDFTIEARGELEPSIRQYVWASENGIVSEIHPNDGDQLDAGALILKLRNDELAVQLESLQGEIATSRTRLAAIESLRIGRETSRDPLLTTEHSELTARVEALERQLIFLKTRLSNLQVRSPIRGKLFGSGLRERFLGRPVVRGQYFCEIAELDSNWELRLRVSEADIDHLMTSAQTSDGHPMVTYALATRPGEYVTVPVSSIGRTTELDSNGTLFTEVIAGLPQAPSGTERPGTGVTGRIHCGKRSLGYVCFRHVSEYLTQKLFL
ncbi:MAG: hypothetical protein U0996_22850 [Planctomycetaceae bacterium]